MIDKTYLRGIQIKNAKCYLPVRDIKKKYIMKIVFKTSLCRKSMYIINMVA